MISEQPVAQIAAAVPAATILLLRDGGRGLEVFMVKRHHEIEFGGGALVFPGGKTSREDYDPALAALVDGATDRSVEDRALAIAAIREAFEEAGVLLARDATNGEFVSGERLAALDRLREVLEQERIGLSDILRTENLRLACDQLVPFAHWITPRNLPRRFDTHFFLARAPEGHAGQHCGRESVDSLWVRPTEVVGDRVPGKLMFPTRMNLIKLAGAGNVDAALAAAGAALPLTVVPWMEEAPDGTFVRIRDDAGYEVTRIPIGEMM